MKFYMKTKDILTDKNISDSRIVAIADLHYIRSLGKDFLDAITEKIKSLSPRYICFLGDLVDDDSREVIEWLNNLAKIAPVFFAFGNHDVTRFAPAKGEVVETHLTPEMISEISNIDNLEMLNNGDISTRDGFSFAGLPFYEVFEVDDFVKKVNGCDLLLDPEHFNSMLVHNPWIMKEEEFRKLNPEYHKTDLILSGHTHNGLVPHSVDKIVPGNRGLYTSIQGVLPDMTRGNVSGNSDNYSYDGIIVPALRTVPDRIPGGKTINNTVYPPAIELVRVLKRK